MAWLQRTTTCLAATLVLVAPIGPAQSAPEPTVISTSVQPTDTARTAYEQAQLRVAGLSARSAQLAASADAADAEAERMRAAVADDDGGFVSAIGDLLGSEASDLDRAAEAADNAELIRGFADQAAVALADAIDAAEEARLAWERAERQQQQVEAAWTADEAADAAIRRSTFSPSYEVRDTDQDRRNHHAQQAWHRQLRAVARNAVVPPPASELADPTTLPSGLEPVRDARNDLSPGVAEVDPPGRRPVTVLPAETVRAVSEALHRVGVTGATDPTTYACGGLVAQAWTALALPADAAAQWDLLRAVPPGSAQPGDAVILGSRSGGIDGSGVYVGRDQAVVADPTTGVASVQPLGADVLGIRRPGVASAGHHATAPSGGRCGIEAPADGAAPLDLPMAPGSYDLTTGFGEAGELWASGEHTGLDFAAPRGTPVVAAGSGAVTVEHPDWAGTLVRIDHGGGIETLYAHLSATDLTTGAYVDAGDPVGLVGDRGNTTGPHLHFEVRLDGMPYDPAAVLALPELPRPSYENGEMPDDALCPATPYGVQELRCDAAVAFRLLAADYADAFGTDLCLTDSYRSRPGQVAVFDAKPHLAAVPGTSVHGLGLAVDACGRIESFGTPEHEWLVEHGPALGWHHPSWAAAGGSRPEPWHFEYDGG